MLKIKFKLLFLLAFTVNILVAQSNSPDARLAHDVIQFSYNGPLEVAVDDYKAYPVTATIKCNRTFYPGASFKLLTGPFRSLYLNTGKWKLISIDVSQGKVSVLKSPPAKFGEIMSAAQHEMSRLFYLTEVKVTETIPEGSTITFNYTRIHSAPGDQAHRVSYVNAEYNFGPAGQDVQKMVQPACDGYKVGGSTVICNIVPAAPQRIEIRIKAQPDKTGTLTATIFRKDKFGNVCNSKDGELNLRGVNLKGVPAKVQWASARQGRILLTGLKHTGKGVARIKATDTFTGHSATSNAALANPEYGFYFGDLHFHTNVSYDGDHPLSDAFVYGRDVLNLDWLAPADHNPGFLQWPDYLMVGETFNRPHEFVTIPAYEEGAGASSIGGHINVYMRTPGVAFSPQWYPGTETLNKWQWDFPNDVIIGPHATNIPNDGHHLKYLPTPEECSSRLRLFEMVQTRGSSEVNLREPQWGMDTTRFPHKEVDASARAFLNKGHKLGFVGGTDNHQGHPTRKNSDARHADFSGSTNDYCGLTVIRSKELTRDALWLALDNRMVYATTGAPILANFRINKCEQGSECKALANSLLNIEIAIYGTDQLVQVELISNAGVVKTWNVSSWDFETAFTLNAPLKSAWYYVRARQADTNVVWTSPIWVN